MRLDSAERTTLLDAILAALREAVPGSDAVPRGSLATGQADQYSDIDVLWEVPDALFEQGVRDLENILSRVRPVESLRSDPLWQNSAKRRLIFVRFQGLPLFWRLDLEVFARSIHRDRSYALENPEARGEEWSRAESALMNAVAAIKAHLRGDDGLAEELLDRGFQRIGLEMPELSLKEQILELADQAPRLDPQTSALAERIRTLAIERLQELEEIRYSLHAERPISAEQLRRLYDHAGWWPNRTLDGIAAVLDSGPAVGAWDGDSLIGFARAVDDTKFRAYVEDVVVHADYRRCGVASSLISRLLDELRHFETISLFCNPAIAGLYEARGFQRLSNPDVVLHRRQTRESHPN